MHSTPRTLIRQVQKDLSPVNGPPPRGGNGTNSGETKNLMRAFIGAETVPSADHRKIIENPVFNGYYPQIVDRVFSLGRYAADVTRFDNNGTNGSNGQSQHPTHAPPNKQKVLKTGARSVPQVDPYASVNANSFTAFENFLIFVNFTLLTGIVMTVILLALFFLFLNNALYLREEIV